MLLLSLFAFGVFGLPTVVCLVLFTWFADPVCFAFVFV